MELILEEEEPIKFRLGSTFYSLPLEAAQRRVEGALEEARGSLEATRQEQGKLESTLGDLKRTLESKFGDQVRLEA